MLKGLFQYVVGLSEKELMEVDSQTYATGDMHLLKQPVAKELQIHTLSGLVEYVQSGLDNKKEYERLLIQIESPTSVRLLSELNLNKNRECLAVTTAMFPEFSFDRFYDTENFNIKMQSCFVDQEDREIVLKVVGNITEDDVKTYGDDGVSQVVTAKTGVATVSNVKVPNPVVLKPYRTFVQIDQPASEFIFRMKNGPTAALFEADGGAWKVQAMKNISEYLHSNLAIEVTNGKIRIIS